MVMAENMSSVNWLMRVLKEGVIQDDGLARDVTVKTSRDLCRRDYVNYVC